VRTLVPIFGFVLVLTVFAFYVNNNLVPKAALEAYSLLYDIKQKKPALDLREGAFYDGIPNMNIKVNKKYPDGVTLKDIIIYDHRKHDGNREVTVADSGKMYTILNEQYLKLELFNGYNYNDGSGTESEMTGHKQRRPGKVETLSRSKFDKTQIVFDLSSFQFSRTDKKWFQGNRIMRNLSELQNDIDSISLDTEALFESHLANQKTYFTYYAKSSEKQSDWQKPVAVDENNSVKIDSVKSQNLISAKPTRGDSIKVLRSDETGANVPPSRVTRNRKVRNKEDLLLSKSKALITDIKETDNFKKQLSDSAITAKLDSVFQVAENQHMLDRAAGKARSVKSQLMNTTATLNDYQLDTRVFLIQWHKILASSLACIAMFFIGAPLGAIIKKGGLGVPFLVSILFFIIYYLLTMTGEKWAKQGMISVSVGVWAADIILLIVGLLFLRQARLDARLFEADFYLVVFDQVKKWFIEKKLWPKPAI
jgi:lipopolysaccharide export system permease protein